MTRIIGDASFEHPVAAHEQVRHNERMQSSPKISPAHTNNGSEVPKGSVFWTNASRV